MKRIICLYDQYEHIYVKTNATKEMVEKSIEFKNDVRLVELDNGNSDFEIMEKFLNEKGYIFSQIEMEHYYW